MGGVAGDTAHCVSGAVVSRGHSAVPAEDKSNLPNNLVTPPPSSAEPRRAGRHTLSIDLFCRRSDCAFCLGAHLQLVGRRVMGRLYTALSVPQAIRC